MKIILFISFIILVSNSYSQTPFTLSKEKNYLLNKIAEIELIKKDHDSNISVLNEKIDYVNKLIISFNKSKDSLTSIISKFNVSEKNLKSFNILKSEKILDKNSKKFSSYLRQIKKEFSEYKNEEFLLGFNHFYIRKNDKSNKIISIDKFNLSNRLINKQDKLLKKGSISFLTQNDSILELYTGVNSKYLLLLKQKEEMSLKIINKDSIRRQLQNSITILEQNKAKVELELKELSKRIEDVDNAGLQFLQQQSNYLRYHTKHINGIDIYTSPLSVQEFRNNEAIKKARTEGEWNKFIELQIPAYKYKDFDERQGNYGLIYNYYAITDKREITPIGFHMLNLIDLNHLLNQSVFTETKSVDCYCGDGTVGNYESCQNCNYWTESQKKYNFCSNCKNKGYFILGKSKCNRCNGTKKVPSFSMSGKKFIVFPSTQNNVIVESGNNRNSEENQLGVIEIQGDKCKLLSNGIKSYDYTSSDERGKKFNERGYQILICKDRTIEYNDDFEYTKIGDIEIMNTYLNVTKFRNGESIKYINDPVEWELALKNNIPAYCYYNNINDNTGCIYNIHAWNDKRGLIPTNWRSITNNDIVNLAFSLGYEFTLNSSFSPLKPPKGIINKFGEFQSINEADEAYYKNMNFEIEDATYISNISYSINEYNFVHDSYNRTEKQSGYVLCVRDAQNKVEIKKNNILEKDKSSIISKSKLLKFENKYFESFAKSGDYTGVYNEYGVQLIDNIVKNNFEELFDKNGEIRVIAMSANLACESIYCCGYTEYIYSNGSGGNIIGLIIKKNDDNDTKFSCSAIIANTSQYNRNTSTFESKPLKRIDELLFNCEELDISFCFSRNKCEPSNNPKDNFYIKVGSNFGYDTNWYSKVKGAWWDSEEEWALNKVLEFMNSH